MEAAKPAAPGEPISLNVWAATFARRTREWQVPLIALSRLGLEHDEDGLISSRWLTKLESGTEAQPYADMDFGVVYKLFDLTPKGSIGKKIVYEPDDHGGYELAIRPARLQETIEKLETLHLLGSHPTEIVGISDSGHYLVVKQPLANVQPYSKMDPSPQEYEQYRKDRDVATAAIRGIIPKGAGFRQPVAIACLQGHPWLISDLHTRNILRDAENRPTIIDALIGPLSPTALKKFPWLMHAFMEAKLWRESGCRPASSLWQDSDDSEL